MVSKRTHGEATPHWLVGLLGRYDLDMTDAERIPSSNNGIHRVTTSTGIVVVRVHRRGSRTSEQIALETRFLEEVKRAGTVTAPELVRTVDGEPISHVQANGQDALVTVLRWIPGTVRRPGAGAGAATVRRIGRSLGLLHVISARWPESASTPSIEPDDLIVPLLPTVRPTRHRRLIEASVEAANALYRDIPDEARHRGVVHNDVIFANCVHRGASTALIDFDDCGRAPYIQDLGAMLENIARGPKARLLREEFLEGYGSVRALPCEDEVALDIVTALRHAWTTAWSYDRAASGDFSSARMQAIADYRMEALEHLLQRL